MTRIAAVAIAVFLTVASAGCGGGARYPTDNIRDYHVTFHAADASESCPQEMKDEAAGLQEYSQTYRIHWLNGPDDNTVDLYWKARGDADSAYSFFASGTLEGSLDDGAVNYAGGSYEENRGAAQVTYRIEGRARTRFSDELPDSTEEYIITASSDTASYPVGCVYTLYYDGNLASEQDGE